VSVVVNKNRDFILLFPWLRDLPLILQLLSCVRA
jgi:hypothetical protein